MAIAREEIERVTASLIERLGVRSVLRGELMTLQSKLPRVARSDAPVLIRGEHGAEKEQVARAVHYLSPRATFPFVTLSSGSLAGAGLRRALFGPERRPEDLVEARGLVRAASGGTFFLDEVERLDSAAQGRLLRWLREGEAREVRIICGAGLGLQTLVEEGRFRPDLYYRINVIPLTLAPSVAGRGADQSVRLRVIQGSIQREGRP